MDPGRAVFVSVACWIWTLSSMAPGDQGERRKKQTSEGTMIHTVGAFLSKYRKFARISGDNHTIKIAQSLKTEKSKVSKLTPELITTSGRNRTGQKRLIPWRPFFAT